MAEVRVRSNGAVVTLTDNQTTAGDSENVLFYSHGYNTTPRLFQLIAKKVDALAYSVAVKFYHSLDGINWVADSTMDKTLSGTNVDDTDYAVNNYPWKYTKANLTFSSGAASITILGID